MSITGSIVLFAVIWFMIFLMALQIRVTSQADAGSVVPGTPAGAPANFDLRGKMRITTFITVPLWAVIYGIIISGWIGLRDIDLGGVLGPAPAVAEKGE